MGPVRQRCTRPCGGDCCAEHEDFFSGAKLSVLRISREGLRVVTCVVTYFPEASIDLGGAW